MIRFTWLQSRTQSIVALVGLAVVGVALALTGPHLVHLYETTVANCNAQGDCDAAIGSFLRNDGTLRIWLGVVLIALPGIIGIFWGAPLVARELETGTYRLAWTQSVTRTRWLAVKLGIIGLTSMAVAGLLSLMVSWWASPFDKVNMNRFTPGVFDQRGVVAIGYAAFACALGVTAGVLIRRTLPAMATSLFAFLGARLSVIYWIRPRLVAPLRASLPVTSAHRLGFTPGPSGVTFVAGSPSIPNALVVSSRLVDKAGNTPTASALARFVRTACPGIAAPPPATGGMSRSPADRQVFQDCVAKISAKFHEAVTYQPASRYMAFQWYEMAIFLGAALILAGFCFWWVRRRHA
jgi:hypothetical protein